MPLRKVAIGLVTVIAMSFVPMTVQATSIDSTNTITHEAADTVENQAFDSITPAASSYICASRAHISLKDAKGNTYPNITTPSKTLVPSRSIYGSIHCYLELDQNTQRSSVISLQKSLKAANSQTIEVDGYYGPATRTAVKTSREAR